MTSFIVLEAGSQWPEWVTGPSRKGAWFVTEQHDAETPGELADRVADLAARQEISGLKLGILACNERSDAAARAARRIIIEGLLRRLAPGGRVTLTASSRASGASRRELCDLARVIDSTCEGSGRSVTVRFGEPAEELPMSGSLG